MRVENIVNIRRLRTILLTVTLVASVLVGAPFAAAQATTDYDNDNDGYIDVSNLAKLNAMRWDLNGDGTVDNSSDASSYAAAFPNAVTGMGCPSAGCKGYELTRNLNFDTDGDGDVDADDDYWDSGKGWDPIGGTFTAKFRGNSRTISNLFINRSSGGGGLFDDLSDDVTITYLGLRDVNITAADAAGALAATSKAQVGWVYSTGSVMATKSSANGYGGAAGGILGRILNYQGGLQNSWSAATVSATGSGGRAGGLVGRIDSGGGIGPVYSQGRVSAPSGYAGGLVGEINGGGIGYGYAAGVVSGGTTGGLVGRIVGTLTTNDAYWDSETTGVTADATDTTAKTTDELQDEFGTSTNDNGTSGDTTDDFAAGDGIYADWRTADWDFRDGDHYPALKASGFDSTPGASWQEFGTQDPEPTFASDASIADQVLIQGTAYTSATAFPAVETEGNVMTTYSVASLPTGITLNSSRQLTGTASAPLAKTSLTYKAADTDDGTDTLTFNISVKPKQPTGFGAQGGNAQVTLTWTAIAGVSGWQYQQNGGNWADISGSGASTVTHTVTGLTNGSSYSFKVRAVVGSGATLVEGVASNAALVTPSTSGTALGFASTVQDQAYTQGTQITQLTLPAGTGGSGTYTYALFPSSPPAGITYSSTARTWTGTPTAAAAGPPAIYVWVVSDGTNSVYTLFTVSVTTKPLKPSQLEAEPGAASATLSWQPDWSTRNHVAHTEITGWEYRQSDDGTFDECGDTDDDPNTPDETAECFKAISGSNKDTRSHEVTGLTNGTEHTFQIRAVNPAGNGAESDEATVTPLAVLAAPTDLAAARGNYKLTLTWKHSATVNGWFLRTALSDRSTAPADDDAAWRPWQPVSPTKDTVTGVYSYEVKPLGNAVQYWVQVRGAAGTVDTSVYEGLTGIVYGTAAAVSGTPQKVIPTPTGLTAAAGTDPGTVTLSWDQAPDGVQVIAYGYRVREKDTTAWQYDGVGPSGWENTADGEKHSWVVDGLIGGTEYEFQVRLLTPLGVSESGNPPEGVPDPYWVYSDFATAAAATPNSSADVVQGQVVVGEMEIAGGQGEEPGELAEDPVIQVVGGSIETYVVQRVEVDGNRASVDDIKAATKTAVNPDNACDNLAVDVAVGSTDAAILAAADAESSCHSITTNSRYIDADGEVHNFQSGKRTYWLIAAAETYVVQRVEVDGNRASVDDIKAATKTAVNPDNACDNLAVDVAVGSTDAAILAAADAESSCHSITTNSRYIDADGEVHNFQSGKRTYWQITQE